MYGNLIRKYSPIQRLCTVRNKSEQVINIEKLEKENSECLEVIDEDLQAREKEIQSKRNKSRLKSQDYNILHGNVPYKEPTKWFHGTVKYSQSMYGRYGKASGTDPSLCWPTEEELADKIEYEKIAHPFTIQQMVEEAAIKHQEKEERIQLRQKDIIKNMAKLEQFKKELKNKIAKKEEEAMTAKERKERLVEEVRRHFGYTVDPRDEKFKEMLEKKEKEQKKVLKMAKKKAKEEKLIESLQNKKQESEIQIRKVEKDTEE